MTASNSAVVMAPTVSSVQRVRASRTARISAASVAPSAARAATARAARCGWPVRSNRRRSARSESRRSGSTTSSAEVLGDGLGQALRLLEDARELGARRHLLGRFGDDDAQLVDGPVRRRERAAPQGREPHAPRLGVRLDLEEAPERRREARGLVEIGEDRVEAVHRAGVARVEEQRLLERVGGALGILGGAGQQIAERHEVNDARLAIGIDGGEPAQGERRVGPVAPAREAAHEAREGAHVVGRREERAAVGLDGGAHVGEVALREIADAHPGGAHDARVGRGGDHALERGDRLGRATELGLHLGEPRERLHGRRVELDGLGERGGGVVGVALAQERGEREQAIAALDDGARGGAPAHDLREAIGVGARAQDGLERLEVGLGLGLEREHLLEAARRELIVVAAGGVEAGRAAERIGGARAGLREPREAREELGGGARLARRLAQPAERAQRRQEGRVRVDGALEVGVGAAQIARRQVREAELPQEHGARRTVGGDLGQLAPREHDARPIAAPHGVTLEDGERSHGGLRVDDPLPSVRASPGACPVRSRAAVAARQSAAFASGCWAISARRSSARPASRSRPSRRKNVTCASSATTSVGASSSTSSRTATASAASARRQARSTRRPGEGAPGAGAAPRAEDSAVVAARRLC